MEAFWDGTSCIHGCRDQTLSVEAHQSTPVSSPAMADAHHGRCSQFACQGQRNCTSRCHPQQTVTVVTSVRMSAELFGLMHSWHSLHELMPGTSSRGDLSKIVSRPVLADAPSCLSQALRDRLSSCDMMVTFLCLLKACANQLFPAPAARGGEHG